MWQATIFGSTIGRITLQCYDFYKSANVTGVLVMELARCYRAYALTSSMQRQSHVSFIHSSSSVRTSNSITEIETRGAVTKPNSLRSRSLNGEEKLTDEILILILY